MRFFSCFLLFISLSFEYSIRPSSQGCFHSREAVQRPVPEDGVGGRQINLPFIQIHINLPRRNPQPRLRDVQIIEQASAEEVGSPYSQHYVSANQSPSGRSPVQEELILHSGSSRNSPQRPRRHSVTPNLSSGRTSSAREEYIEDEYIEDKSPKKKFDLSDKSIQFPNNARLMPKPK